MPSQFEPSDQKKHMRISTQLISIVVLVVVLGASLWAFLNITAHRNGRSTSPTPVAQLTATPTHAHSTMPSASATPANSGITRLRPSSSSQGTGGAASSAGSTSSNVTGSPLLFGTNLSLVDTNDQFLTSATTRSLMQQLHVRIVRFPMRSTFSEPTYIQVAQDIKSIGALPLVIMRPGNTDPNSLADDTLALTDISKVFGGSTIYAEYGNEVDLLGVTAQQYAAAWNKDIPQLKKAVPNARFIGPADYHYDRNYLQAFLQNANPRPDYVSWHEYTCATSWPASTCLSHIDNWSFHITDARVIMNSTIGTRLPIMITEWNYTPGGAVATDGKSTSSAFMTSWTTKALQTFAANGVFASMQFAATGYALNLIAADNTVTAQGSVFESLYPQMAG